MKVSLNWVKEFTAVKVTRGELLRLIGERLGAIDEVAEVDDDLIIDIENKMFTHRPDCFGMLGIAREIAGIQHLPFKSPDWYLQPTSLPTTHYTLPLEIRNEAPALVPRFMAVVIDNIRVAPSPARIKSYLVRAGVQPVNSVVDATNYMMLLTGQPLHAYDYDKLAKLDGSKTAALIARKAKKGEKVSLLDGKEYQLREGTIVIASRKAVVGIGGVMGAENTEVDERTRRVVIECANFDMYAIRRASMAHGIFTDAVARFNKGQSPAQTDRALAKTITLLQKLAGGKTASKVFDEKAPTPPRRGVKLGAEFVNERLGLRLGAQEMQKLLANVEFEVKLRAPSSELLVTAPFWRTDIHIPEDVVEEIGRLHGYGQLPLELPKRDLKAARRDQLLDFKHYLRQLLARAGANEVLTYSFVHGDLMEKVGQDPGRAYRLSNALSPELQYYRTSLLPSLLAKVRMNVRAGYERFAIFEIGKAHIKGHMDQAEPRVPAEEERLALVITDKNGSGSGAAYYQARAYLAYLLDGLRLDWQVESIDHQPRRAGGKEALAPFEQKRSGYVKSNGELIGFVGEFKPTVQQALKLPPASAGLELDVLQLLKFGGGRPPYRALPEYPKVSQDITLKVPTATAASKVQELVDGELVRLGGDSRMSAEITGIYQSKQDKAHRNITFRIEIANYQRTLTTSEVNDLLDAIAVTAKKQLKAERV